MKSLQSPVHLMWGFAAPHRCAVGGPPLRHPSAVSPALPITQRGALLRPAASPGLRRAGMDPGAIGIQLVRLQLCLSQPGFSPSSPPTDTCTPVWREYLCLSLLQGTDRRVAVRAHYPLRVGLQNSGRRKQNLLVALIAILLAESSSSVSPLVGKMILLHRVA